MTIVTDCQRVHDSCHPLSWSGEIFFRNADYHWRPVWVYLPRLVRTTDRDYVLPDTHVSFSL